MNTNFFKHFLLSVFIILGLALLPSCKETSTEDSSSTAPTAILPGSGQSMPLPSFGENNNQPAQSLSWNAMSTVNQPTFRVFATSVWTGSEMIVWGGNNANEKLATGAAYNPTTNSWRTLAVAPEGRSRHSAIWTGQKMFIYGGRNNSGFGKPTSPFLVYDPITDTWSSEGATGAPAAVEWTSAVWTGYEIVVYGGKLIDVVGQVFTNTAYAYNPTTRIWRTLISGPKALNGHAAVWTGYEMVVVGGSTVSNLNGTYIGNPNNSIFVLDPINGYWATQPYTAPGIAELSQTGTGVMYFESTIYALCAYDSQLGNSNRLLKFAAGVSTTFYNYKLAQPAPNCDYATAVWTGTEILAWGSWYTPFNSTSVPPTSQIPMGLRISHRPAENPFITKDLFNLPNNNSLAEARSMAIAPNGDVYTAGIVVDTSLPTWFVRKSSDGGNNWQIVDTYHYANGSPANANAIAIDSTGVIYVGGFASNAPNGGTLYGVVRKSTDQGATWTTVLSFVDVPLQSGFGNGVLGLSIDRNNNIYAVGSDGKWVTKRSTDGGMNWTNVDSFALVNGRHASATGITQRNGDIHVVGFAAHADNSWSMIIRKSSDAGATWSSVDTYRLNTASYAIGLSIAVDSLGNVYASGFQGNFQIGTFYPPSTWILRKSTPTGWVTMSSIEEAPGNGSFARSIAVDAQTLYVGGLDSQGKWTIKRSKDAGATWTKVDSSINGTGVQTILCTADKIYASGNLGGDWVTRVFTK